MDVAVVEPGQDRAAVCVDRLRGGPGALEDLLVPAELDDPSVLDRDRLRDAEAEIDRDDLRVIDDEIGGFLLLRRRVARGAGGEKGEQHGQVFHEYLLNGARRRASGR